MNDYHPKDPNKGISIRELLKKNNGKFRTVVEKHNRFDPTAKPRKPPLPESEFVPDPNVKDEDGNV